MENKLPLGVLKQAFMKLESFVDDINDACNDPDLNDDQRFELNKMTEVGSTMSMRLLNIIKNEMGEEDFINENIDMDEIGIFPEHTEDDIEYVDID